jgi:hypothetical protein
LIRESSLFSDLDGQLPHGGSHRSRVLTTILNEFFQVFLPPGKFRHVISFPTHVKSDPHSDPAREPLLLLLQQNEAYPEPGNIGYYTHILK